MVSLDSFAVRHRCSQAISRMRREPFLVRLKLLHDWRRGHFKKWRKWHLVDYLAKLCTFQQTALSSSSETLWKMNCSLFLECTFFYNVSLLTQNEAYWQHLQWRRQHNDRFTGNKTNTMAIPGIHSKLRHFSSHIFTGRSFNILNVCIVLEENKKQIKPVYSTWYMKNAFFYPEASIRACALKLGFDNAKRKSGLLDNKY